MIQLGKMYYMTFLSQVLPSVSNLATITGFCEESQYCDFQIGHTVVLYTLQVTYESLLIQLFIAIYRCVTRMYVSTTIRSSLGQ